MILEGAHEGIFETGMFRGGEGGGEGVGGRGTATGHGIAMTTGEEGAASTGVVAMVDSEVVTAIRIHGIVTMRTEGAPEGTRKHIKE